MKFLLIIVLLFIASINKGFAQSSTPFPIYVDGKGGYIDSSGRIIIEPRFDQIKEFTEGIAAVKVADKWGYIERSGNFRISPRFSYAKQFVDDRAIISENGKYGYINKAGSVVIHAKFDKADDFFEGVARVKLNNKWKFIDKDGTTKIETDFEYVDNFYSGLAIVAKSFQGQGLRLSYINKKGELSSAGWLTFAGRYSGDLAVTSTDLGIAPTIGKNGVEFDNFNYKLCSFNEIQFRVINKFASIMFERNYNYFNNFSGDYASVGLGKKCGYISVSGNNATDLRFDSCDDFSEGMAQVKINNENYIIDKNGKEMFKVAGTIVRPFMLGLAQIVSCKDAFCQIKYINSSGKNIWLETFSKSDHKLFF